MDEKKTDDLLPYSDDPAVRALLEALGTILAVRIKGGASGNFFVGSHEEKGFLAHLWDLLKEGKVIETCQASETCEPVWRVGQMKAVLFGDRSNEDRQ